jgi:hypothetical protein
MPGDLTRGTNYLTGAQVTAANLNAHVEDAVIVPNAITTPKILNSAVATEKIAGLAATGPKIGPDAITEDKIADGAVQLEHFAPDARPITYDFGHATDYRRGHRGLVPEPVAGERLQFLRADGWQSIVPQVTETVDAAVQVSPAIAHYNNATFS